MTHREYHEFETDFDLEFCFVAHSNRRVSALKLSQSEAELESSISVHPLPPPRPGTTVEIT